MRNRNTKGMDQIKFYKLCEEFRNRQEDLLRLRMSTADTAKYMSERLGFPVSGYTIDSAKEATGITWDIRRKAGQVTRERFHVTRTLCDAIASLYNDLGKPIPQSLASLSHYCHRKIKEEDSRNHLPPTK